MLDANVFNTFIGKANQAHQQFCIWFATNNEFAEHQIRWNEFNPGTELFALEDFTKKHGCKYKNFWSVVVATLQHSWVLAVARLFDPAYYLGDKKQEKPRISLDYILIRLEDEVLSSTIRKQLESHQPFIDSVKEHRDNFHAHNDANFRTNRIEAGVEETFQWLENTIAAIKEAKPYLKGCNMINIGYNEKLSQCGVEEVFETLLLGERYEL